MNIHRDAVSNQEVEVAVKGQGRQGMQFFFRLDMVLAGRFNFVDQDANGTNSLYD